jgi:hypothetical protein
LRGKEEFRGKRRKEAGIVENCDHECPVYRKWQKQKLKPKWWMAARSASDNDVFVPRTKDFCTSCACSHIVLRKFVHI